MLTRWICPLISDTALHPYWLDASHAQRQCSRFNLTKQYKVTNLLFKFSFLNFSVSYEESDVNGPRVIATIVMIKFLL